jgi:hypothetical protein
MDSDLEDKQMDRRTFVLGGASLAGGGILVGAANADAAAAGGEWIPAIVAAQISPTVLDVVPLQTSRAVRVVLAGDATVHSALEAGSTVVIEGHEAVGGPIRTQRIVRGVFGVKSDAER